MTVFNWKIVNMMTLPELDNHSDVVVSVQWQLTGVDGNYTSNVSSWTQLTLQQGAGFTPYNQLTEEQVIGWVQSALGADNVRNSEISVQRGIDLQKSPSTLPESQPLPWASN